MKRKTVCELVPGTYEYHVHPNVIADRYREIYPIHEKDEDGPTDSRRQFHVIDADDVYKI